MSIRLKDTIAGNLSGNANAATILQNTRTIFGQNFNGSANVQGKALHYGNYVGASSRYSNASLEIRENGLVGNAQSDIGYAPQIGFHWLNRVGATLAMNSQGEFQFINQAGTAYSNVRAGTFIGALSGNATTATKWSTGRWLTVGNAKKGVDGSGDVTWTLNEIGAAPASHDHNFLTGVNSIAFAAHETDAVSMGVLVEGEKSYMDFNLADDFDDMWRWRFTPVTSPKFNAMTLQALNGTTSRLTVAGEVYNAGDIVTHNGTSALAYNLLRTSNSGTRNGQTWMTEILTTGRGTSYIGNRKVGTSKGYNGDNLNTRAAHIQLDYDDIIMGARISVKPYDPNGQSLGTSAYPWKEVYCTRGVFNGSDSKLKENIKKIENSKLVTYDSENDADTLTSNDLYEYVKNSSLYSFNYKNSDQNILGILADEIPENIFNKIGTIAEDENSIMDGIKLINASSQIAILQNVLGQTINRIEEQQQLINTRDQEVSELKEELKLIKEKLGLQ